VLVIEGEASFDGRTRQLVFFEFARCGWKRSEERRLLRERISCKLRVWCVGGGERLRLQGRRGRIYHAASDCRPSIMVPFHLKVGYVGNERQEGTQTTFGPHHWVLNSERLDR